MATYALREVAGAASLWESRDSAFNIVGGVKYHINASNNSVDATLATAYNIGEYIIVHNEVESTNQVRLLNSGLTIKGPGGLLAPGDNLILESSDTVRILMKTTLTGEIV